MYTTSLSNRILSNFTGITISCYYQYCFVTNEIILPSNNKFLLHILYFIYSLLYT